MSETPERRAELINFIKSRKEEREKDENSEEWQKQFVKYYEFCRTDEERQERAKEVFIVVFH